ncbi:hypothetical protein HID58_056809 [Brassica napus]|uniref:Uncharacterized protein n=1 Tax=Brassica napus TaxID=3708 RepID=A0ABQ8APD2_BRANA|nr:hypothetical protein HID58_056809 [Brassica napus]
MKSIHCYFEIITDSHGVRWRVQDSHSVRWRVRARTGADGSLPCYSVQVFVSLFRSVDSLRHARGSGGVLIRVVEAYTALASPIKFPGCGGFFSYVAPVKFPEHGGSYRSMAAGFCTLIGSGLLDEFLVGGRWKLSGVKAVLGGLAVEVKKVRSLSAPVWRGESVGDSPVVVEMEMMVRITRRRPTSVFLSWAYGLRCLDFGPSRPFNVVGLRPFR